MSYKKSYFSNAWLSMPSYYWVKAVDKDRFSAGCKICNTTFSLSNMGKQALTSHMKSKKHISIVNNMKSCSTKMFMQPIPSTSKEISQGNSTSLADNQNTLEMPVASSAVTLTSTMDIRKSYLLSDEVTKSEIIWCLHAAVEHLSFRSAARAVSTFKLMFPDSNIASKMQLQRTKCAYTIVHGLAPYFKRRLIEQIGKAEHIVVGFDESLNKIASKQQMDVIVRFWDNEKKLVISRYLTSVFLGHTRAEDLMIAFKAALSDVDQRKIIQISMDGPNVNFKFLNNLKKELTVSTSDPMILDLGSCGLHTLHCAFKVALAATEWDIVVYLRALYNLFKDVPARRADYITYTNSQVFPKKFCSVRWGENVQVVKRAIEINEDIKKYVAAVENAKNKPTCKSYQTVASYIKDELLIPKLTFFQTMATIIEPFITEFQGEAPLSPFLYESLKHLLQSVLTRFVKEHVLKMNPALTEIDIFDKANLKNSKEVDLGYAVRIALKKCKASSLSIDNFFKACRLALQKFVKKMLERSPIKFKLTKGISCLDPSVAVNESLATKRLSVCLEILLSNNWISGNEADKIDSQFKILLKSPGVTELLKIYDRKSRLDDFWIQIADGQEYKELQKFCRIILILAHGNATVERGFSVNKECLLNNQTEESLIALRVVHDTVTTIGGISSVNINKELIHSARNAHAFYTEALKMKEKSEAEHNKKQLEKIEANKKLKELQQKKLQLLANAEKQVSLIDEEIKLLKK